MVDFSDETYAPADSSGAPAGELPPYTRWLLLFQLFNGANFTVVLGVPVVLTARFLGAGESAIGVVLSLTPFLAMIQIFSYGLAERWGYRRMMLTGWTIRSFMLLFILPLPFLVGRVSEAVLVAALIAPLFAFNMVRGLAACAWFPWLRLLIPESKRGYFLGLEQRVINGSVLATMLLSSAVLAGSPEPWRYSAVFVGSWAAGLASVFMLSRAPNRRPPAGQQRPARFRDLRASIRKVWAHRPFRRLTRFAALYVFAQWAVPGFLVLYLRDEIQWSDSKILILASCMTVGVLSTSVLWGRIADRFGSRPVMRLATLGHILVFLYWTFCSLGWLRPHPLTVGLVYIFYGSLAGGQAVAQIRSALANCPEHDTMVGMMVYQLWISLSAGCAPLLWGFALRALRGISTGACATEGVCPAFTIFFVSCIGVTLVAQLLLNQVPEPRAMPAHRLLVQMVWGWPLRMLSGFTTDKR